MKSTEIKDIVNSRILKIQIRLLFFQITVENRKTVNTIHILLYL